MKKNHILLIVCTFITLNAFSQSFYEINWKGNDGVDYSAFLSYYSDDNIDVRVGFNNGLSYVVASYTCKGSYHTDLNGKKSFIMDGSNAQIVYHKLISYPVYEADNFIFTNLDENNKFDRLFVTDDSFTSADKFIPATINSIDPSSFNDSYLLRFFVSGELQYDLYKSYANSWNTPDVKNGTMHIIIVSNTLDNTIGVSCERDRLVLNNEFSNIATALNMDVNSIMIYGDNFTKPNVIAEINSLNPKSSDIVVFYYRGHGYRVKDQISAWPIMALWYSPYQNQEGLSMEEVYNKIVNKGARLNLVFGDLCNSEIGVSQMVYLPSVGLQSGFHPDIEKLKKLFLNAQGNLISVAAKPGEVSFASPDIGGYYTSSIINSLHREVGIISGEGSWYSLIDNAIKEAEYKSIYRGNGRNVQHGIRYIDINY